MRVIWLQEADARIEVGGIGKWKEGAELSKKSCRGLPVEVELNVFAV